MKWGNSKDLRDWFRKYIEREGKSGEKGRGKRSKKKK